MQTKKTLQDGFLTQAKKNEAPVTMFLMNGFQLRGIITDFDSFAVLLETEGKQQLIYKHAISTVVPQHPLHWSQEV